MSVWQRQKNWLNEVLWKPKKSLSIDQLKFQFQVLQKNPNVTDNNRQLLVETFRSITEVLIWGDQNDSRIFDFFLEKNMQSFFLKILSQRCGRYVSIQLLQTLNILFENIKNETSIYYLLSNNHINSIIVLKLDFSDEEILAYYISFLKTLSFHLNRHTIHFFYNEHLRDFPLYAEAIKFFKHSESMVRIAVRTLTLNVYKVEDQASLGYICSKTAVPYFSNLVWFIGNHVIELDECLIAQAHRLSRGRLEQLVAEHLDHLHYISDIFSLEVQCLNDILSDHFLNRLLIPLYVYSLTDKNMADTEESRPRISNTLALFLLSQVFLILSHSSLIAPLAYLIFTGDTSLTLPTLLQHGHRRGSSYTNTCAFVRPETTLEASLTLRSSEPHSISQSVSESSSSTFAGRRRARKKNSNVSFNGSASIDGYVAMVEDDQYVVIEASPSGSISSIQSREISLSSPSSSAIDTMGGVSSPASSLASALPTAATVSPKSFSSGRGSQSAPAARRSLSQEDVPVQHYLHGIPIVHTLFLDSLMSSLVITNDDTRCLFALSMLYALLKNKGVHRKMLEAFSMRPRSTPHYSGDKTTPTYNKKLVNLLVAILDTCTAAGNCVRLVTLRLAIMVLLEMVGFPKEMGGAGVEGASADVLVGGAEPVASLLDDYDVARVENSYETAIYKLRLHYKGPGDEVFLGIFEQEYENEKTFKLNVPYLMMDEAMLLPPTDTPQSGIDFTRRLPSGEYEKTRKIMRVFFALRALSQRLSGSEESELPLTPPTNAYKVGDVLDTSPHDLVLCKVTCGEVEEEHFMLVTQREFLLVDPHKTKLGHGVVHFIAFLQDLDISGDPADGRALYIVAYHKKSSQKPPALSGRFLFEDHIRCGVTKSFLLRSQENVFVGKMTRLSKLLHMPSPPDSLMSVPGLPGSHRGLYQQQTPPFPPSDVMSPSLVGLTPMLAVPSPPSSQPRANVMSDTDEQPHLVPMETPNQNITSSVLHRVFTSSPSSKESSNSPENIELSSLVPSNSYLPRDRRSTGHLPSAIPLGVPDSLLSQAPVHLTTPIPEDKYRMRIGMESGGGGRMKSVSKERLDMSPTPEPTFPDEEGRTASGGMLEHQRLSSSERSRETSVEVSMEMAQDARDKVKMEEKEVVCPLGLEVVSENEAEKDDLDFKELKLEGDLAERTSLEVSGGLESGDGHSAAGDAGNAGLSYGDPISMEPSKQALATAVAVEVADFGSCVDSERKTTDEEEKGQTSQEERAESSGSSREYSEPNAPPVAALNVPLISVDSVVAKPPRLNGNLSLATSSAGPDDEEPTPLTSPCATSDSVRGEKCRVDATAAPDASEVGVSILSDNQAQVSNGHLAVDRDDESRAESEKDSMADKGMPSTEQNHKLEGSCSSQLSNSYDKRREHATGEDGSYLDGKEFSHGRNYEDEIEMFL